MSAVVGSEFAARSWVRFGGGAGITKPSLSRCGCGCGGIAGGGGEGGGGGRRGRWIAKGNIRCPGASRRVHRVGGEMTRGQGAGTTAWSGAGVARWQSEY